jgi:protein SCO1/2
VVPLRAIFVICFCLCAAACAKRYRVEALVLSVDRARSTVTMSHREIPGYMPAMIMPFRVEPRRELDALVPGHRVTFELRRGASVAQRLRRVSIDDGIPAASKPPAVKVGGMIPDFTLTAETGRAVKLSDFRGRVVAIDFIYTRCPLPDVCPRLSANFAALQKRVPDLALVSITVDPQYDTPPVLAGYARRYGADPARWTVLTGPLDDVRRAAAHFGMVFWPDEGMITHTAATAIVGPDGRLAALVEGTSYRWEQLRDLIMAVTGGGTAPGAR